MSNKDKLMGMKDETHVFTSHRIDYDSDRDVRMNYDDSGNQQGMRDLSGAAKCPRQGHSDHPVKDGYKRKVVCETADVKDTLVSVLEAWGVTYTVEDVAPNQSEKDAIRQWGASDGVDAAEALKWDKALQDLSNGNITQADYERGKNPNESEEFDHPKSRRK